MAPLPRGILAFALLLAAPGSAAAQDEPAPGAGDANVAPAPPPPTDVPAVPAGYGDQQAFPPPPDAPPPAAAAPAPGAPSQGYELAPPAEEPDDTHRHTGVFLRLELGLGFIRSNETTIPDDILIHGGAGFFTIGLGGAIADNVIISGSFTVGGMGDPTVESDGFEPFVQPISYTFRALEASVSYYFMPINIYVGGGIGIAGRTITDDFGDVSESPAGFSLSASAGKEWWVGSEWGLGPALRLFYANLGTDDTTTVFGGAAELVVTFN